MSRFRHHRSRHSLSVLLFLSCLSLWCSVSFGHGSSGLDQVSAALGHGFAEYDGTFDENRLRPSLFDMSSLRAPIIVPHGTSLPQISTLNSTVSSRLRVSVHSRRGLNDFTLTLKPLISTHRGGFLPFQSNVRSHFPFDMVHHKQDHFCLASVNVSYATADLFPSAHRYSAHVLMENPMHDHLRASVKNHLMTWPPSKLFRVYGTHVVTSVTLGASLSLWGVVPHSAVANISSVRDACAAALDAFVRGPRAQTPYQRSLANVVRTQGLKIVGGDNTALTSLTKWARTVSTHASVISFGSVAPLPIWDLLPSVEHHRKHILYKHYLDFISPHSDTLIFLHRFASPFSNSSGTPSAIVKPPSGWRTLSGGAQTRYVKFGQLVTRSFPVLSGDGHSVTGWHVQSKDHLHIDVGAIRAFAVATWDPKWKHDILVASKTSETGRLATAKLPIGYHVVGGGVHTQWSQPGCMVTKSVGTSGNLYERGWSVQARDYLVGAATCKVTAYAVGVRSRPGEFRMRTNGGGNGLGLWIGVGTGARVKQRGPKGGQFLTEIMPDVNGAQGSARGIDYEMTGQQQVGQAEVVTSMVETRNALYVDDPRIVHEIDIEKL